MQSLGSRRRVAALGALALILTIGIGTVAAAGPWNTARTGVAAPADATAAPVAAPVAATAVPVAAPVAAAAVPSGALTNAQQTLLAGMAEEEKLAQDLYAAFAALYPSAMWDRIGSAEATHLAAVRTLLTTYAIADPTAGLPAGTFASPSVAAMYADLLAQGSASEAAAFGVGKLVEIDDIAKLDAARAEVTAADVLRAYTSLRTGSTQHLNAFTRQLPN